MLSALPWREKKLKFKSDNLRAEFWTIDPKLRLMLCDADFYVATCGAELTITSLMRTPSEQAELVEKGYATSRRSVHMFGRGADVRPTDDERLNALVEHYILAKYPYDRDRPRLPSILRHGGTADHWHFQCLATVKYGDNGINRAAAD